MQWEEDVEDSEIQVSDDIVDLAFALNSGALPVDHAYALSSAVKEVLPWLESEEEEGAGLHLIHGAGTGNGWQRPESADDVIYISRRTRLTLRLPRHRIDDARALTGAVLDINGHELRIGKSDVRLLSTLTTIYARYIVADERQDEEAFIQDVVEQLRARGFRIKKALCGRVNRFSLPDGQLFTRSLMLADISVEDSIRLQQEGLGPMRSMGCGLFIPHKSINHL